MLLHRDITDAVLRAAIEVHRILGPGLLESVYEDALSEEFRLRKIMFGRQVRLPVRYKGTLLRSDFRMDFVIERVVAVEVKSVEKIVLVHEAQLMTYLRLSQMKVGLLLNFNVPTLRAGVVRKVL